MSGIDLLLDGERHPVAALRMPRPSLAHELGAVDTGFWGTLPMRAREASGPAQVDAVVRLRDGQEVRKPLAVLQVAPPDPPAPAPASARDADETALIGVCLATFDPDPALFRTQIESLRAQTDERWLCLVSDDCSAPERFAEILVTLGDDPRFLVSRSERRLGFYRNFERALRMVPDGVRLIALCDQDDFWHEEKLSVLRSSLGSSTLVYSDQRLTDARGGVLRETMWCGRRNNHTDLASLLVANTITGAATLFRREVAELALPFPDTPGLQFHDHWLGLVALAAGDVAYVDRPLYDYVQHGGAVFGEVTGGGRSPRRSPRERARGVRSTLRAWRGAYFLGYLSREVQAQTLLARVHELTPAKRRSLERFVAADRTLGAWLWLSLRGARALAGHNETLGSELELAQGIAWRRLAGVAARRLPPAMAARFDASFPDPLSFGQQRLRRWRARSQHRH